MQSAVESISSPPALSATCSGIPPVRPATTGVPFHSASETTSPKPSRIDFWIITEESRWNALTSTLPTPVRLVKTWMSGSVRLASLIRR